MICMMNTCQALLRARLAVEPPASVRNRQAAVQYLHEASRSRDDRERAYLRGRAAELILPRQRHAGWWS